MLSHALVDQNEPQAGRHALAALVVVDRFLVDCRCVVDRLVDGPLAVRVGGQM